MDDNIIAIHNRSLSDGKKAFVDLMSKTEMYLNTNAKASGKYKNLSSKDLEEVAVNTIKDVCCGTPFDKDDIKLVSAQYFPDIVAGRYYGVEVKSTKYNHWTSTGSSIVESTRDKNVENIYLLFGKLGGTPVEFKCRPYEDCMCEIAVTHSPRYLINMELKKGETIFDKIGMDYDNFRLSDSQIERVRNFYIEKAKEHHKTEMPWWIGKSADDLLETSTDMTIKLWSDVQPERRKELMAQMLILFPNIVCGDYKEPALWLCSHYSIIHYDYRDIFSAGGQYHKINGTTIKSPLPHIVGKISSCIPFIKDYLNGTALLFEINEFNPTLLNDNKFECWLNQLINKLKNRYNIKDKLEMVGSESIEIRNLFTHPEDYKLDR